MTKFNYKNVEEAYKIINSKIIRTPLITNDYINSLTGANIFFKFENFQITGSFKYRGALNKITKISSSLTKNGVIAYSSGNHAQAVAYASMLRKINAKIIMPINAPKIKIQNTKKYGADILLYDPTKEKREIIGNELALKEERVLIKPYDDHDIIAGQGTAGLEIAEKLKKIDIIPNLYLCCCGGGGLIAGTSTYLKYAFPDISCHSVEPEGFDDTKKSLLHQKIISNNPGPKTICDALLAEKPGDLTFKINLSTVSSGLSVTEKEVKKTILTLAEHLKVVIEPGGAVAAAAALNNKISLKNKNVIVMLSGGNIDSKLFSKLV